MACGTDPCLETTITVCPDGSCDFTDIQSAIDASSFEAIEIGAGTYALSAPLTIGERPGLTLRGAVGEDGTLLTVLDGQDGIAVRDRRAGHHLRDRGGLRRIDPAQRIREAGAW